MEDDQWQDPLLITDVSWQQEHPSHSHCKIPPPLHPSMADPGDLCPNSNQDESWRIQGSEASFNEYFTDPVTSNVIDGRSVLGFSLTTPDLVLCAGSPDIPSVSYEEESSRFSKGASIELSLENGINGGPELETSSAARQLSVSWKMGDDDLSSEASLELLPVPKVEDNLSSRFLPVLSINAGSSGEKMTLYGTDFLEDSGFSGGDIVTTGPELGDVDGLLALYRTARIGNFSYHLKTLGRGSYMVDFHFAEIVLTDGCPGMRVFDVYLQDQKAISCVDINERVGANRPLVISNLRTSVSDDEGLFIRFEGVVGSPLVCGISVKKDLSASFGEVEFLKAIELSQIPDCKPPRDSQSCEVEGDAQNLQEAYECQKRELNETRRVVEELKSENERKSRECQEAWKSLKDLQNELMRKSMHVGSLAFAIEGQVKEKSKWFTSLRDLKRKLTLLKMDHIKLSEEALLYKNCLEDVNRMSDIIQTNFNQQVELHEELKVKFIKGSKERKELYNKVLELKGNIRVFCRCRPLNSEEIAAGASMAVDFEAAKDGELTVKSNGSLKKTFKYDAVFDPQSSQVDVFDDTAPFVTSVLDGYNVCIFAYGQTGTGKTFTMEGTEEARGVNFRTLDELFRVIKERKSQFKYEISVSVLEVYNEQIRDLLVSGTPSAATAKRLEVRQVGEGTHHVPGLVEANVSDMREVWEVLQTGSNARAVGSTNANEHSSRSHCIHLVMVKGENLLNGEITRSKLWLVDLAGSERVAKTEVQGERLKETQNINRSLSALGDVISALATKSPHIPFRNSKLTHLLQDSLGGDSKTLMFVQISPNENDLSETLCSLNFASRVRGVELGPAKKQLDNTELFKYKQSVEKSKLELKTKDVQIKKLEDTVHVLDVKMKEKDLKNKNLQDKIKELESQLMVERRLARQHVDSKIVENQQQAMREHQQEEQNTRPPLVARPLTSQKNMVDPQEQVNQTRPLTETNIFKLAPIAPPLDNILKQNQKFEKENNNPEIAERLVPKRTGRASLCPTAAPRIQTTSAQRRNSLIPLPSAPGSTKFQPPLLPLPQIVIKEEKDESVPELTSWDSPKEHKSGGGQRKISSIMRRSMQKRVQIRSPMHQNGGRRGVVGVGGINMGMMEKVRLSIGSRGRIAHRVLPATVRRPMRDVQQKQINHREKERGWNSATTGKVI